MEEAARIVVSRTRGGGRDLFRSYGIEIDGVRAGTVGRGESVEFAVTAGVHDIRAVIDWTGSPTRRVEVADGEAARLTVMPGGNAFELWHMLTPDGYVKLSVDRSCESHAFRRGA